ncbi:MAG: phosphoribosylaminoimidazole-succinocarboxamide synthase [Chloroflexi bacterium]|jgi:phosphoribosylaminoimidazole-succinocarboxamide synthase|nr:MAG: phosphoribosylaminoimidazole-succinocarboxamide synthase [Chloroflexota bacterium]
MVGDLKLLNSGKVREIYELNDELLLIVTSDRISAFDVIMDQYIPEKGKVLNNISAYWFNKTGQIIPNAYIGSLNADLATQYNIDTNEDLFQRSTIMKRAQPLKVECIVRGYITGSGWKEYQVKGSVSGIPLELGLKNSSKLPEPLYTPSTKADIGEHDEAISYEQTIDIIGEQHANTIKTRSLALYEYAAQLALKKGIIIADTKFEFGLIDGEPVLIDEVLTPDSSRFWPTNQYQAGKEQESFDKQILRNWLEGTDWNKESPPPVVPADIIDLTSKKYVDIFNLLSKD